MDLNRFRTALDLAVDLHKDHTWPGTCIPYVAHALEVACRVAALGGREDTILAALLHDAAHDRNEAETLQRIRTAFGDRVAELLGTCWEQRLLPHCGWPLWMPACAPGDPELHLIVGCDVLCGFRNILLDWQTLAHLWDESPRGDLGDRLWLQQQANLPDGHQLVRERWIPSSVEHPTPHAVRRELMDFFQGWMALPLRIHERTFHFPSLALSYQEGTWARWVESEELVSLLASWGLGGLAQELRILLGRLNGLPGMARAGFLRQSARNPDLFGPEVAAACLEKLTLVELKLILGNRHSRLVHAFRRYVPVSLQGIFPVRMSRTEHSTLAEPILLHCLGEVAADGHVIDFPPLGRVEEEVAKSQRKPFHPLDRLSSALTLLFESHAVECWPITTIPYVFHSLEVFSLMLTAGWDEDTAILGLLHDLPRTEDSLHQVQTAIGPDVMDWLGQYWRLEGLVHRVPYPDQGTLDIGAAPPSLTALTLMDATSLLRFVAEDYQSLSEVSTLRRDASRAELSKRLLFFKGFLYGKPIRNITETVLIGTRFGPAKTDWQKVAGIVLPKPSQDPLTYDGCIADGAEEILVLLARLEIPQPELVGLGCLLESMEDGALSQFVSTVSPTMLALAFLDPGWDPIWKLVMHRLDSWQITRIQSELQSQGPDEVGAIRSAQKTILATAARMRGRS